MAGVLNPMNGALMDPQTMGLLQTGLGLMAGSGPSRMPVGLGQVMGQVGMQGIQGMMQAQQANQQGQMFQMKLAEAQRQEEERKKKEAAMQQILSNPQYAPYAQLLGAGLPLSAVLEREMPKPKAKEPFSLKPGESRYDENGNLVVSQPDKPEKPVGPASDLGKLRADLAAGLITQPEYDAKFKKLTTHQPPIATLDMRQDSEFNKAVGREFGQQYADLMRADFSAPANIAKYQRLQGLLGQVNTGRFSGTVQDLKAAAKGVGIDLTAMGVRDDVAPAQAAKALSNQLALELRNPAGGAGMPGALSDQDRQFLLQMIPSIENDPGAISHMIEYRVKLAKREQQVAKKAREYRRKHNRFDDGFFDELQDWSNQNPLFSDADKPKTPTPAPTGGGRVVDFGSLK